MNGFGRVDHVVRVDLRSVIDRGDRSREVERGDRGGEDPNGEHSAVASPSTAASTASARGLAGVWFDIGGGLGVAHDVFISYSSKDKAAADALCAILEGHGIRSFIAPRDILAGRDWGEAIVEGIERSRLFVLVFSRHANASQQIKREVERAVSKGITVVPLRIEDVLPAGSLEYFLSTPHWLDAITPPFERHLDYVAETVKLLLERGVSAPIPPAPEPSRALHWRAIAAFLAGLLIVALLGAWIFNGNDGVTTEGDTGAEASILSDKTRFVGGWTSSEVVSGENRTTSFHLGANDDYSIAVEFSEVGKIVNEGALTYVEPDGGQRRQYSFREQAPGQFSITAWPTLNQMLFSADQIRCSQSGQYIWKAAAPSPGAAPNVQAFELDHSVCNQAWNTRIELFPDGRYTSRATTTDTGRFVATDGGWKMISTALGLTEGRYEFVDEQTVTMTWPERLGGLVRKEVWRRVRS